MKNCDNCGTAYVPRNKRQKFCSTACRVKKWRKKNGLSEPSFLKPNNYKIKAKKIRKKKPRGAIQSIQVAPVAPELLYLQNQREYIVNQIHNLDKGVFPFWSIGLAGLGAVSGESAMDKIILGALGAFIGNSIQKDLNRKPLVTQHHENMVRQKLLTDLRRIDEQINAVKRIDRTVARPLERSGIAIKKNDRIVLNAESYIAKEVNGIGYGEKWGHLIGDPSHGYMMLLHGMPGNGKTTAAVELAQYHTKFGKVLFVASEQQGVNKSLQDLMKEKGAKFDIHTNPKRDLSNVSFKGYSLAVIDSVNHLGLNAERLEEIRREYPTLSVVAVMQSTKGGNFKGSQEFAHNSDVIVELDNMKMKQTKSRFRSPTYAHVERG